MTASSLLRTFAASRPFQLDPFQREACESLARGANVLVCAPTGAGKTVVGEFAAAHALTRGGKCFYTTPIKALSNQKYRELAREFGDASVGLMTGDTAINSSAPVVVMTTEVLRNMLYGASGDLVGLSTVVLDEIHYLADRSRGAVWEEVLLQLAPPVQVVGLSATVSNAEQFGAWVRQVRGETNVIVDEVRPIPLHQQMLVGRGLYPLYDERVARGKNVRKRRATNPALLRAIEDIVSPGAPRGQRSRPGERTEGRRGANRGGDARSRAIRGLRWHRTPRPAVVRRLDKAGLLPAIVFIFSRAGCDAAVAQCVRSGLPLLSDDRRDAVRSVMDRHTSQLPRQDLEVLGYAEWRDALERGIASHHAGLLPAFKAAVEELFTQGLLKVVFATETLALGINMPARTVVLERLVKFNGESHVTISAGDYTQLTGRAGRRGIDVEGHAVVMWTPQVDPAMVTGLASTRTFPLHSSFRPTYNMTINMIDRYGRSVADDLLARSFAQFQRDDTGSRQASAARRSGNGQQGSLALDMAKIAALLLDRGYLTGDRATGRGKMLQRIWGECDLLAAECLQGGVFASLSAPELAGAVSTLVFESRRDGGGQRRPLVGRLSVAVEVIADTGAELAGAEREYGVAVTRQPDSGFAAAITGWAEKASLADCLLAAAWGGAEISAGDFVRWARQVVDLLDQMRQAAPTELIPEARRAVGLIRRGIVALDVM